MSSKRGFVYIMFNKPRGTLYVGVTSDLLKRVYQHKSKAMDGFTKRYSLTNLGYYEEFGSVLDAIEEEKRIKGGSRAAKFALIETLNPDWSDLFDKIN